ncbi:hypothetical protein Q4F19_02285 [Sphingomonas sp. BIUV-7]|uniref:Uncharacterized protein n=1 Tax=Sphingomonas natans TaxID=3063330 RepID=A0ABT8Y4F3_9SPHN|nr:hypothetical protein [Sphingomonas sp. BIUV-7]MDO6413201.1 hypothetical protein [Sphingomonas sp. BIUV-7]
MILLFLLAAQSVIVSPLPRTFPGGPGAIIRPLPPRAFSAATYDVDVRLGSAPLWSGPMRVSDYNGASFSQEKTDGSAADCAADRRGGGQERSSLLIRLSGRGIGDRSITQLTITVMRPGAVGRCEDQASTRTVGLTESFAIEPGQDVRIEGDGGLSVRVHRR